jgi:DNA-binding transcriptional LysR family regulator
MDSLQSIRVFCAVAELKSFRAAAERLALSPAVVSKHVMALERRLSTRLLNRSSRSVGLTSAGALYLEQVRRVVDDLDEVESLISDARTQPRGILRITAPGWFASPFFAEVLAEYQTLYPQVTVDVHLSSRVVNLAEEGFDLALRSTNEPSGELVARRLRDLSYHLVAAPSYLDRAGRPRSRTELDGHAFLAYSDIRLTSSGVVRTRAPESFDARIVIRSDNDALVHLTALQGQGIGFLPLPLIQSDLDAGRLEIVLPNDPGFSAKLYAVYPSGRYLSKKVRSFVDFVTRHRSLGADD